MNPKKSNKQKKGATVLDIKNNLSTGLELCIIFSKQNRRINGDKYNNDIVMTSSENAQKRVVSINIFRYDCNILAMIDDLLEL